MNKLKNKIREYLKSKLLKFLDIDFKITETLKPKIVNSNLHSKARVANLAYVLNSNIEKHTSIGRYSNVLNADIGKYCSISYFSTIGATRHPIERISTNAFPYIKAFGFVDFNKRFEEKVILGNDVWVGASVVIKPGVKISDGAVIGAGAVVTKDVPPYAIVAGVPAKIIRYRFDEKTIGKLLEIKWWNLDEEILKKNIELFQMDLTVEKIDKLFELAKEH